MYFKWTPVSIIRLLLFRWKSLQVAARSFIKTTFLIVTGIGVVCLILVAALNMDKNTRTKNAEIVKAFSIDRVKACSPEFSLSYLKDRSADVCYAACKSADENLTLTTVSCDKLIRISLERGQGHRFILLKPQYERYFNDAVTEEAK